MSPDRTRLEGRTPLSRTTVHGAQSVLIGIGLLVVAGTIGLAAFAAGERATNVPQWLLAFLIGLLALASVRFIGHGLRGIRRRQRVASERARHPYQPWRWDYAWDPRESRDRTGSDSAQALRVSLASLVFLVPFHWVGFTVPGARPLLVFAGVLDMVFLGLGAYGVVLLLRRAKYRGVRLVRATHPFLLGRELSVDVVGLPREIERVTATLRCVEEVYEERKHTRRNQRFIVLYELYAEQKTAAAAGSRASFTFTLPEGGHGSRLHERPPLYWELEAVADAPGLDFRSRFLLPVYADPAASAPPA